MLKEQYRMHPAISHFPNQQFYKGAVVNGPVVKSKTYRTPCEDVFGPFAFIDVEKGKETKDETSGGWINLVEAEFVQHLIMKIRSG